MRVIPVAVAGLGGVGRETVRLLRANAEPFRRRLNAELRLTAVCDRDAAAEARALGLGPSVRRLRRPEQLADLRGVEVVVELLGGLEAPRRLALQALRAGRHLVTANKLLLASCWSELAAAARAGGGRLRFEGSVAGGIPLLQALDQSLAANRIESVYGILNGTTNFVLSRAEAGVPPDEALREAQRLGLAEKDPSLDLSGRDTAQKLSVLAALLTGSALPPERIAREGIARIEAEDVAFARETLRCAPRLLGSLSFERRRSGPARLEALVFPSLVPLDHPLASVRGAYNAVFVRASAAEDLLFYGKGAGPAPTASAVVGDLFLLARELLGGAPAPRPAPQAWRLAPLEESVAPFYVRLRAADRPGVLSRVAAALARRKISIASIHQPRAAGRGWAPVALTTHPAPHGRLRAALREIGSGADVSPRLTVMRLWREPGGRG